MSNIPEKFTRAYNASETEDTIYKMWETSGYFNPDQCCVDDVCDSNAEVFSLVLPPPNVTGTLHTGHSLMLAIEDVMTRYARMQGKRTLWIPGTDHAAISTESVIVKQLAKEKTTKFQIGREAFLDRVNKHAQDSHDTIVEQTKKMGASLDWSREAFTLDDNRQKAVYTAFTRMYHDGLIYQGNRIVNWDTKGQTTVSDDEVDHEERKAKMYTFKYSHDCPIEIATTRPETKIGDTAIAVHPDGKWQEYIGQEFSFDFAGELVTVKVIGDTYVDPEFGTGALGVTPAHSQADFEIAQRHDLPIKQVINEYGKMMVGMEGVIGTKTEVARLKIVAWLEEQGLLLKTEDITQNISLSQRTNAIIEPLPKIQWWVDVNKKLPARNNKSLKDMMLEVVRNGETTILPERFEKIYFNWIENLRDWNISRQIWYGHRIPVWYDKDNNIHLPREQKFTFMRHGETEFNRKKIIQSQSDSPLTPEGIQSVIDSIPELAKQNYTKIISSDLGRAQKTAEIIAKELGLEVEIWPELREVEMGDATGTSSDGQNLLEQALHARGAETPELLEKRAQLVIEKMKQVDPIHENILLVGHTNFTSIIFAVWNNIPKEYFITKRKRWMMQNAETQSLTLLQMPQGEDLRQDEDTLDTWFSSGLWTFSTLGWPDDSHDLKEFHPTSVLETGHDIIFFWVARMILMSTYLLGEVPFKTVYLHGMVLDKNGKKMSKSNPETAIDPLVAIEKYGTDALRMAMIVGVGPGQDISLGDDKIKAYSKFANKIWNATRFVLENTSGVSLQNIPVIEEVHQQYINDWKNTVNEITQEMNEYKFYLVAEKLYHFFWHTFADVVIEECKNNMNESAQYTLVYLLTEQLKALHPFMPFITEEIWQSLSSELKNSDKPLIIQSWPKI